MALSPQVGFATEIVMKAFSVSVLVGSLRRESFSLKLATYLERIDGPQFSFQPVNIGDLAFYNEDLEVSPPPPWLRLRQQIRHSDAVLFVTPEYNRSIPAVLKNAIDVASRPLPENSWNGKPAGVISVSPGAMGAFGAHHHLRQSMVGVNMRAMPQPEAYLGNVRALFNDNGDITNSSTVMFLRNFLMTFAEWIQMTGPSGN
jgi:chromate reductase